MDIAEVIAQFATMNPIAATITLSMPAQLVVGVLFLERRFTGRTSAQRRDIIELIRAIRGKSDDR